MTYIKRIGAAKMTPQQETFMETFTETNDVYAAMEMSGMTKGNFNRDSVKDTPFGLAFRQAMNNSLKQYDFSKLSSLKVLQKIRDKSFENEDYAMAISAVREMAKMADDHLAVQKRIETKRVVDVTAVIDFSKPAEIPETVDVTYTEFTDSDNNEEDDQESDDE